MAEKRISIRLAVEDAEKVKAALEKLGRDGQSALRGLERGAAAASPQLLALDAAAATARTGFGLLRNALGSFGVGLGVGALVGFAKSTIESVGNLGELADQLGVSTQALQTYQFAAGQTGVKQAELETSLAKLTASLGEAAQDTSGPAAQAFKRLGVDLAAVNAAANPTEAALRAIAEAARQSGAGARFAADAKDVLGKSAQRLVPMLKAGAGGLDEFGAQAARVSDATIAKFDALGDKIAAIWARIKIEFAEGLGAVVPDFRSFVPFAEQLAKAEERLRAARAGEGGKGVMPGRVAAASAEVDRLREMAMESRRGTALTGLSRTPLAPPETDAQRRASEAAQKLIRDLENEAAALGMTARTRAIAAAASKLAAETGEDERILVEMRAAALFDETAALERRDAVLRAAIEAGKEETEGLRGMEAAYQAIIERKRVTGAETEQEIAGNERLIAALKVSTEEYEKTAAWIELNNRLRAAGLPLTEEESESNRRLAETLGRQRDEMDRLKKGHEDYRRIATDASQAVMRGFEDAIVSGQGLRGVLFNLVQDLQRISFRAATNPIGAALGAALQAGIGGLFGGAPAANTAGLPGGVGFPTFGGPRAEGGPVDPSHFYKVGEHGQEWFRPGVPGRIVPNDKIGGVTVNVTNHIDARGADAGVEPRLRAMLRESERRTIAAVAQMADRGGRYAKALGRR